MNIRTPKTLTADEIKGANSFLFAITAGRLASVEQIGELIECGSYEEWDRRHAAEAKQ